MVLNPNYMSYKELELAQYKSIWLTKESHAKLRAKKKELRREGIDKSMAKIVNELILKNIEDGAER